MGEGNPLAILAVERCAGERCDRIAIKVYTTVMQGMIRYVKAHATGPTATASDTGRAIEDTAVCPDAQRKQSHGGEPLKTLHGAGRQLTCETPT